MNDVLSGTVTEGFGAHTTAGPMPWRLAHRANAGFGAAPAISGEDAVS